MHEIILFTELLRSIKSADWKFLSGTLPAEVINEVHDFAQFFEEAELRSGTADR